MPCRVHHIPCPRCFYRQAREPVQDGRGFPLKTLIWHNYSLWYGKEHKMDDISSNDTPQLAKIIDRNINALVARRKEEENKRDLQSRVVDAITSFTGSMNFVYIHLAFFLIWVFWNLGWLVVKPFDPSFIILATFAAVEAIFISTFVLISQNKMNIEADKRAELDLQISLLTEHEATRMITILTAIAKKIGLEEIINEEIEELSKDIQPEKVLDKMESESTNPPGI